MLHLDLKALREYDETALKALLDLVDVNWGSALTHGVVHTLYDEGVSIRLVGDGIRSGSDVSYAFYSIRMSSALPLKWTVRCVSGGGASHHGMGGRSVQDLLVAGSLDYGRPVGISSTWMLRARKGSADYYLGLYLNDLFLSHYHPGVVETPERLAR